MEGAAILGHRFSLASWQETLLCSGEVRAIRKSGNGRMPRVLQSFTAAQPPHEVFPFVEAVAKAKLATCAKLWRGGEASKTRLGGLTMLWKE
jgi:hypothetical protein